LMHRRKRVIASSKASPSATAGIICITYCTHELIPRMPEVHCQIAPG
jgi:hypothetical protein